MTHRQNKIDWLPLVSPLVDYDLCVRAGNNMIGLRKHEITGDSRDLGGVIRKYELPLRSAGCISLSTKWFLGYLE